MPCGPDLLFAARDVPGLVLHVEVCEDLWVPVPPSAEAALAGATVLLNLSGSPITVGRADERRLLVRSASARCLAAYLYAAAGQGESSTDLSWDGQTMVYEMGDLLAETERFPDAAAGRWPTSTWCGCGRNGCGWAPSTTTGVRTRTGSGASGPWASTCDPPTGDIGLRRAVDRFPFVPDDAERLALDCYEAYNIQVSGLEQRLRAIGQPRIVIGVSGGLDSTHALIVAAKAMDRLGRPRSDVLAFTMPGFATSPATKDSATKLSRALGVSFEELDIRPAARQLLGDLGHAFAGGEPVYDVTFENVQAGLRTDYLFRLANQRGGIVLGTGDLSELALGWCTYGVGDQMSHYAVNAGVPKTLIQHLIRWVIGTDQFDAETNAVLEVILRQEISPELVPVAEGERPQSTEEKIGPYALQDFTLFHVLRYGFAPSRIAFLAQHAWSDVDAGTWPPGFADDLRTSYDLPTIRHWMEVFLQRFFAFSQFKRSAIPNGPKVVAGGSLSPRGDWRAPSDGNARVWLDELHRNVPDPSRPGVPRASPDPPRRPLLRPPTRRGVSCCVHTSQDGTPRRGTACRTGRLGGVRRAGRDASAGYGAQDGTPRRGRVTPAKHARVRLTCGRRPRGREQISGRQAPGWASRKSSCSGHWRSATSASCGCGSPTCWAT